MNSSERDGRAGEELESRRLSEEVDRILAGAPSQALDTELENLVEAIAAEKPGPSPAWAEELDNRVRDGFEDGGRGRLSRLSGRLRPHRRPGGLAFGGALAGLLAALVVSMVAIQSIGGSGGESPSAVQLDGGAAGSKAAPLESAEGAGGGLDAAEEIEPGSLGDRAIAPAPPLPPGVPGAPGVDAANRKQDRSARLELRAEPGEVREVSDEAISIVEAAGGFVLNSSLTETDEQSTAFLLLDVPTGELDAVLDRLTDLATVGSLSESVTDITAPFVSARARLADARAERQAILEALSRAEGSERIEELRKQARKARNRISRREAELRSVRERAERSQIDLTVNSETAEGGVGGPAWDLGDAAEDALRVLVVAAGVGLIALAVIIPLGLVGALAYPAYRRTVKRRRERALETS